MTSPKQNAKLFKPKKTHERRRGIFFLAAITLVVITTVSLLGFVFWRLDPPLKIWLTSFKESLTFKRRTNSESQTISFEKKARNEIEAKVGKVERIEDHEDFTLFKLESGREIFLEKNKDLDIQVQTLQTIFSKAKIEGKEVILVDFRFSKLVVRYK